MELQVSAHFFSLNPDLGNPCSTQTPVTWSFTLAFGCQPFQTSKFQPVRLCLPLCDVTVCQRASGFLVKISKANTTGYISTGGTWAPEWIHCSHFNEIFTYSVKKHCESTVHHLYCIAKEYKNISRKEACKNSAERESEIGCCFAH